MRTMNKKIGKVTHTSGECSCESCQEEAIEAMRERERQLIKEHGHSIRYVFNSYQTEFGVFPSIITRGLLETENHLDLELVLPVDQQMAMYILNTLADLIHKGFKVELNTIYQFKEFNEVPIYFEKSIQPELEEPLYRVILADPAFKLPMDEGCDPHYQLQAIIGQLGDETSILQ